MYTCVYLDISIADLFGYIKKKGRGGSVGSGSEFTHRLGCIQILCDRGEHNGVYMGQCASMELVDLSSGYWVAAQWQGGLPEIFNIAICKWNPDYVIVLNDRRMGNYLRVIGRFRITFPFQRKRQPLHIWLSSSLLLRYNTKDEGRLKTFNYSILASCMETVKPISTNFAFFVWIFNIRRIKNCYKLQIFIECR